MIDGLCVISDPVLVAVNNFQALFNKSLYCDPYYKPILDDIAACYKVALTEVILMEGVEEE